MHIWEKVSEQQQQGGGCAAWRIRLEDRGCCCSYSLTDETVQSSGHIHMLIEERAQFMANCLRSIRYLEATAHTHTIMDRDIHSNTLKETAKTLNRLAFWFLAGSASLRLQTFDDKWPSTHLKWESSQRIAVIDSFFTKRLNRKKFPPDRTADQTEPPAKDICSRRHNCHRLRWLIHEQYVVWAAGPCCRSKIEQRGTARWWPCWWWLFQAFPAYADKPKEQNTWMYSGLHVSFNSPHTIQPLSMAGTLHFCCLNAIISESYSYMRFSWFIYIWWLASLWLVL